jgi:hypothetical protein
MSSVFARPTGNVTIQALAHAVSNWTGTPVQRIDMVETPIGAVYTFVHFTREISEAAIGILCEQQVTVTAGDGFVTIGLNTSNGYNSDSPDAISHIVYADNEIYCVNRTDWSTYMWSSMEEAWVPTDISMVAAYLPNMPCVKISDQVSSFIASFRPPAAPEKKKKKRYIKTHAEKEIVRQLFV